MIRVFPRRTKWTPIDDLVFVGDPPLFRPEEQEVCVSVSFTWDIPEGERLADSWSRFYRDVKIGGPAFGDPGGEFVPGRFLKEGITITSRGCPKICPKCLVPEREGKLREIGIHPGWIVQDNNLLACSDNHIRKVFDMLRETKKRIFFSGGIDAMIFSEKHVELFDSIRINEISFACDYPEGIKHLHKVAGLTPHWTRRKRKCYVMVGHLEETIREAEERIKDIYRAGFDPFCQLYRGEIEQEYSEEWLKLARVWSRPHIYHSVMKGGKL